MRALIVSYAGLALCACSPSAPAPRTETEAQTPSAVAAQRTAGSGPAEFQSPTGNLGCSFTPAGGTAIYSTPDDAAELKCDRVEPAYARITLPEHGAASVVDTQERGCCGGETLAHGTHWSAGPFQCDVSESGLSCTSAEGHGFTLSRETADTH